MIPIIPDVYVFFRSVFRIIYPYVIYLVLDYSFKKRNVAMEYSDSKKRIISLGITTVIISLIVMLISCKFRYGVIVVGSGSMTGALNVGDVVIFESYKTQKINKDDVIIFNRDDVKYIHRVVKISLTNGEYRYYTKGDANLELDEGFVTKNDMVGVSKLRIKYIGYPSILLRNMFD
jgi:signal peptidase I